MPAVRWGFASSHPLQRRSRTVAIWSPDSEKDGIPNGTSGVSKGIPPVKPVVGKNYVSVI